MTDRILIRNLTVSSHIGVPLDERAAPQPLVIDADLSLDTRPAALADDFTLTIDYAAVCRTLTRVAADRPRALIETLAEDAAAALLAGFPAIAVRLRIAKPRALADEFPGAVPAVEIERTRHA
jgi:dihydroneopterin aldolase